jgi:hypothetical protein
MPRNQCSLSISGRFDRSFAKLMPGLFNDISEKQRGNNSYELRD